MDRFAAEMSRQDMLKAERMTNLPSYRVSTGWLLVALLVAIFFTVVVAYAHGQSMKPNGVKVEDIDKPATATTVVPADDPIPANIQLDQVTRLTLDGFDKDLRNAQLQIKIAQDGWQAAYGAFLRSKNLTPEDWVLNTQSFGWQLVHKRTIEAMQKASMAKPGEKQ